MAFTPEQKRELRAQRKRARAADNELRGVKPQPRGRAPLWHRWDESAGMWVLDDGAALHKREPLPLPSRPHDLNAWAAANQPPRRDDFETQEQFDKTREPWYATLMGQWLPPYGDNAARAKAWGIACRRQVERSISHDIAKEHAAKKEDKDAAAATAAEAERARKAEEAAADARLKAQLADCERRNLVEYHEACGQWHHPNVPCEQANLWPMHALPEHFREHATGILFVEGTGPVQGHRRPEECQRFKLLKGGGISGSTSKKRHPWWSQCACLHKAHPWYVAHQNARNGHVQGESVIEF